MRRNDLSGQKFEHWTVLGYSHSDSRGVSYWFCRCDCGKERAVRSDNLKAGFSTSCWCSKNTHGMSNQPIYKAWMQMKQRCQNPNDSQYNNYGARGIYVCPQWQNSFAAFLADMGEPPPNRTLDRINNDGPYSPENCRWATFSEQACNSRQTHFLEYCGQRLSVTSWARMLGFSPSTLYGRLKLGWSIERALTEPVHKLKGHP